MNESILRRWFTVNTFRYFALLLGLTLILIVNREFGVADNGDFDRYITAYTSKPIGLSENVPPVGSPERNLRFFSQPLNYWSPDIEQTRTPWFTSASLFWMIGDWLNSEFYSQDVVNVRYFGFGFFLIHAFAFAWAIGSIKSYRVTQALVVVFIVLLFTDARITAFYNSFYAEAVPLIAVILVAALFFPMIFEKDRSFAESGNVKAMLVITVFAVFLAIFAKRQYLYFTASSIVLTCFLIFKGFRLSSPLKVSLSAIAVLAIIGSVAALTLLSRAANHSEANAVRITSYHALYFGLLPQSKDPSRLIQKLDLPPQSIALVGRHGFTNESLSFISSEPKINLGTFLKAVYYEPTSFIKSVLWNAQEVGNFDIPIGMVYGAAHSHPPQKLTLATAAITKISGLYLFLAVAVMASCLILFDFGLSQERQLASRMLAAIMLLTLMSDVFISAFDGQQEARKHVLIASTACLVILVHAMCCLVYFLTTRIVRRTP